MKKTGAFFVSITQRVRSSVWDPHAYRGNRYGKALGDYVTVAGTRNARSVAGTLPFGPIEYRHIPKSEYLSFMLEPASDNVVSRRPTIGEQQLLFGTMRAYLGNVIVTPRAEWLNLQSPLLFALKAEFVRIEPYDGLRYFWWAYLRSELFLENLPLGSGGTRPRLQADALLQTPVRVPDPDTRMDVDRRLHRCAQREWREFTMRTKIFSELDQACRHKSQPEN